MVWVCCWRPVDTRAYTATRIRRSLLVGLWFSPTQQELVRPIPTGLSVRLLDRLPPNLPGAPHDPPAAGIPRRNERYTARLPQPQRPPPPGQTKPPMTGPAEFVTCDQTIEHTVRFAKQTLGWTTPRPRHPEQADRWTWLVLAAYTQLRLARAVVADHRLPWERPRSQPRLSPYRVRRGFPRLLPAPGSPAATPKPSGRSPGRPKGHRSGPAKRYPAIKKTSSKATKPQRPPERPHHRRRNRRRNRRPEQHACRVKSQA
jgi:hypothetical protein